MAQENRWRMTLYLDPNDPAEGALIDVLQARGSRKQDLARRLMKASFAELLSAHGDDPGALGLDPTDTRRVERARREAALSRFPTTGRGSTQAPADAEESLPPRPRPAASTAAELDPNRDKPDQDPKEWLKESAAGIL
jgi:hypothetical protein